MNYTCQAAYFKISTAVITAMFLLVLAQSCKREEELDGRVMVYTAELKDKTNTSVTCGGNTH